MEVLNGGVNMIVRPQVINLNGKKYIALDDSEVLSKIKWIELNPKDFTEKEVQDMMDKLAKSHKYEKDRGVPVTSEISVKEPDNKLKADRAELMSDLYRWYSSPKVDTRDDIAVEQRINYFLRTSAENGELLTVEKLALALGVSRLTLNEWKHGRGCSNARTYLIGQMYELIHAFEATLAYEGKINPTMYIFRSKNNYDMVDRKEVAVSDKGVLGDKVDMDVLEAEFEELLDEE